MTIAVLPGFYEEQRAERRMAGIKWTIIVNKLTGNKQDNATIYNLMNSNRHSGIDSGSTTVQPFNDAFRRIFVLLVACFVYALFSY